MTSAQGRVCSSALEACVLPKVVDVNCLRRFPELVRRFGGDPHALLRLANIEPVSLSNSGSVIEYGALLQVMQLAADALDCPDFGMRLAALQGGNNMISPLGIVMKNSKSLGQAIDYCAKHTYAYSAATRLSIEPDRARHLLIVGLHILLDPMPDKRQAVEHALLLASLTIREVTRGRAPVRTILLSHEPIAPPQTYHAHFGCEVRFDQHVDALVLTENDLLCPIVSPDAKVYEMATSFVELRYPRTEICTDIKESLHSRVRSLVRQYLGDQECTSERIAAEMCLHPRTLQRRLRAEGTSFEDIKDEIRREAALRYLRNGNMPLKRVAQKLGYAETSVLSRSCYRWFSAGPRQLRRSGKLPSSLSVES